MWVGFIISVLKGRRKILLEVEGKVDKCIIVVRIFNNFLLVIKVIGI